MHFIISKRNKSTIKDNNNNNNGNLHCRAESMHKAPVWTSAVEACAQRQCKGFAN